MTDDAKRQPRGRCARLAVSTNCAMVEVCMRHDVSFVWVSYDRSLDGLILSSS